MQTAEADLIVADFNIDIWQQYISFNHLLCDLTHTADESTHIERSPLDYCHVRDTLFEQYYFKSKIISVFFSDHDTLLLLLYMKTLQRSQKFELNLKTLYK